MLGYELSSLIPNIIDLQQKRLHGVIVLQDLKQLGDALQADAILAEVHGKTPAPKPWLSCSLEVLFGCPTVPFASDIPDWQSRKHFIFRNTTRSSFICADQHSCSAFLSMPASYLHVHLGASQQPPSAHSKGMAISISEPEGMLDSF